MDGVLKKFQDLKIKLEDIISATNNFNNENYIGGGGYGIVYKGELSHSKGQSMVAIKRLDRTHGQGEAEFLKEIDTLSRYRHENLISLLGFCYQGNEAILVYELASHGSLDKHLNSNELTWSQRIKICLDAAKGLRHLHDPKETHQRLIHCDVKGGNILLDDDWNAKVADFGFSVTAPAKEQQSTVINLAGGTHGYIDPLYRMSNTLTKESDVYSFGVVLFEVLCGTLCCTYSNGRVQQDLVPTWIKSYEENKLNDIIFKNPASEPMHLSVLKRFSGIAYQCLKEYREDRPQMDEVVKEIERVLNIHELLQNKEFIGKWNEQLYEYQEMVKTAKTPLNYGSEEELMELLYKGILLNSGKTYFSLNKKGEHCEMISIAECLDSDIDSFSFSFEYNSRFATRTYRSSWSGKFKTGVKTQFLSPGITYTVNLVFKFSHQHTRECNDLISLKYKLQGETKSYTSHLAYEREDGWWMCELYQFTCDHRIVHLQILFDGYDNSPYDIVIEGIEFRPLEKVEHKDVKKQPISDSESDANWEEKMPIDYEDLIKRSENSVQWTTKEEAYSVIRKGFVISNEEMLGKIVTPLFVVEPMNMVPPFQRASASKQWFYLDKNGKKCHMQSAALIWYWLIDDEKMFLPKSRFGAIKWDGDYIFIGTEVQHELISSETTYACYLVYKLPEDQSRFEVPMEVKEKQGDSGDKIWYIYLASPQTPVIRPKAGQNTHNPLSRPKITGLPQQRNDGWIEVQIWELRTATTINIDLMLRVVDRKKLSGLIIEGIEFRPM